MEEKEEVDELTNLLSSIMTHKSKLGTVKHPLLNWKRSSIGSRDTSSRSKEVSCTNMKKNLTEGSTFSDSISHESSGLKEVDDSKGKSRNFIYPKSGSMSVQKLTRSVSTPEINDKFKFGSQTTVKSSTHRKIHFDKLHELKTGPKFTSATEYDSQNLSNHRVPNIGSCNDHHNYFKPHAQTSHFSVPNSQHNSNLTDVLDGESKVFASGCQDRNRVDADNNEIESDEFLIPSTKFISARVNSTKTGDNKLIGGTAHGEFRTPSTKSNTSISELSVSTPNLSSQTLPLDNGDLILVNSKTFLKLRKLGQGGSCIVYQVWDLQSKEIRAVKIVNLRGQDPSVLEGYINEMNYLKKLQYSSRIIKLYSYEVTDEDFKLVLECGEIDLASILNEARLKKNDRVISTVTMKHYWQAMLLAVQVIHKEGIIHSDLKPANFLLVQGTLKLIDFGISSSIQQDNTSVFKDSQPGTYNYMSPESLNDVNFGPIINGKAVGKNVIKLGVKSDVWSLGCILYNLVYGRTPFQHITNILRKLAAISNSATIIQFPPIGDEDLINVLQLCLQFDPKLRPSIEQLLRHPYLKGQVLNEVNRSNEKVKRPFLMESREDSPRPDASSIKNKQMYS